MEDTSIVCEFSDMFLDNLSRITPEREVEFNIELASTTTPISKALYHMASIELHDLKKQL